jgi:signal transduction histidine kinase
MAFPRVFSLPHPVLGVAYVVGYVLLDWISYVQPFATFGITPWNPPTGLSFVLVLLFGQRFLPLLFLAPLLADLLVRQLPLPWSIEIATSAIIGGGYAAGLVFLLRPATRFNPALTSMRDLIVLLAVAAASSAAVAVSYVGVLAATGWIIADDVAAAAFQFWIGDLIGIAVVAPFALIFFTRGRAIGVSVETAVQLLAIIVALVLVFFFAESHHFEFFYVLFLPMIWMAVRGGLELVTIGNLVIQIGLILSLQLLPAAEVDVTVFQALMLVLALTGLAAGAVVTERRRMEYQLRLHQDSVARVASLGSMGELAAMIAHEINQPLMAAGTYSRMVADTLRSGGGAQDSSAVDIADKAAAQVQRAADVVRQLRALIRLDQSGRAPVSFERVVRETLDLYRPALDRHGIAVRVALDADLPPVMIDLLQIEQVLLNLLRNAAEAMAEAGRGGTIVIAASVAGPREVAVEVRDTGPGFPPEFAADLPLLSSSKAEGLGVGLSLCRSIVEAHGGRIAMANEGGGAVVRFTLPVAAP